MPEKNIDIIILHIDHMNVILELAFEGRELENAQRSTMTVWNVESRF